VDVETLMAKVGDSLSVRRAFGAPIDREGVTVIPVAVAIGGGGGGSGPDEQGSGGGFGGVGRGIGVFTVTNGQVRFVPAVDAVALGTLALLLARTLVRATRRGRR
jgi:uncharacterized spore protein YtfJ